VAILGVSSVIPPVSALRRNADQARTVTPGNGVLPEKAVFGRKWDQDLVNYGTNISLTKSSVVPPRRYAPRISWGAQIESDDAAVTRRSQEQMEDG
jgi:hypothetical protein